MNLLPFRTGFSAMVRRVSAAFRTVFPILAAGSFAAAGPVQTSDGLPFTVRCGPWPTSHVQGTAVDLENRHLYFSFTTLLVKTDFSGKVLGTLGGVSGHLGDITFNPADGRIYGSLEYKKQHAFYAAIINGREITRVGMDAGDPAVFRTVHLAEAAADYRADLDGDGSFGGDTADTADHRYGCSGIDGVAFGPRFGTAGGPHLFTVAYGVYGNPARRDNDHQVLLQYDAGGWWDGCARPLDEKNPHRSGPEKPDGKFFVRTGNTTWGVQNLEYDGHGKLWLLGVYPGKKTEFPNYGLFAVDAAAQAEKTLLQGVGEEGMLLPLAEAGGKHTGSGVRGWHRKVNTGLISLGDGRFLLTAAHGDKKAGQSATMTLHRWTGAEDQPFEPLGQDAR